MSRLVLVLVVCGVMTGCTRRQQDVAWFAVAVAAEVASHAAAAAPESSRGVAVATTMPDDRPLDLQRAHDAAYALTRTAAHDARIGECVWVVRASERIRQLDPAVHANVFLRDEPILHCLRTAPEPVLSSGITPVE